MKIMGIAGWSGAGKTTLITRLIPQLRERGLRVATIKHAHHAFDVDIPGKDSYEHRAAGATEVIVLSSARVAQVQELRGAPEPPLSALLKRLGPCDIVLIEGYKRAAYPKLEVFRRSAERAPLHPQESTIVAIASDVLFPGCRLPQVHIDDIGAIRDLVLMHAACAECITQDARPAGLPPQA